MPSPTLKPCPTEASPRPWRVQLDMDPNSGNNSILDANGNDVVSFYDYEGTLEEANARLIVDAVNERDRLRDLVRRLITIREHLFWRKDERTGGVYYDITIDEDEARRTIEEARAALGEEGRRLSTKPFGRPATEQEVDSRFPGIEWCMHCTTDCPLSHHDALCVCDHYNAPDKKGGTAP